MGIVVRMLLWAWIILDVGASSVELPEITDAKFIEDCVMEHNRARSSVSPSASNMFYMSWDAGLAITARAWAKQCVFKHNIYLDDARRVHPTFSSVGENIWTGSPPSSFNVKTAIKSWEDEKADYDYQRNTCSNVCTHYTQVVWDSSYKVGCAVQRCPNGVAHFNSRDGVIFICNYAPRGNMNGMRPFESSNQTTSGCKVSCGNKLCCNKERDSPKSYNWSPDWDPALAAPDSNFVSILVVRPVALTLTFIAAFAVHYFYPDVFCYE
ncbi:glioma pathoproteinsis-related 1 [Solea senegalensis]|uniref:Glioma pathoproteinsis-related 1 n=1 Tax=Solea senegalensis TaxID=28829 RepID=A0AAV6QU24_SOLSE|nr:GLIPR1-like protein 1 isoform X1 [Solea senegalensis]KAG7495634.1 glioma pathoproteinsis-related 1 [Solea senegalensis]